MENTILKYVQSADNQEVKSVKKSRVLYLLFIVLSLAMIGVAISPIVAVRYSSMMLIMIAVVILCIAASMWAVMALHHPYKYVYYETGEELIHKTIYLGGLDAQKVISSIQSGDLSALSLMKPEIYSEYYLDVWGTKDGSFYLFQVMKYVPQQFEPASEVVKVVEANAMAVKALIDNQK